MNTNNKSIDKSKNCKIKIKKVEHSYIWFNFEWNESAGGTDGFANSTASAKTLVASAMAAASDKAVDNAEFGGRDMALDLLALPELALMIGFNSAFFVVSIFLASLVVSGVF